MLFNQPLPRANQPTFAEGTPLASVRDDRNDSLQWKKNRTIGKSAAVQSLAQTSIQQQLNKLKRRQIGYTISAQLSHPFKIYQPTNFASFSTGITFLDPTSGAPTVCNIDATKPTDFTATPPTVNPSESWRFWAVRSGQVEIRPNYTLLNYGTYLANGGVDVIQSANNLGYKYEVQQNTDGINPAYCDQNFDDSTNETRLPPLIIARDPNPINQGAGQYGGIWFAIWLIVTPDTSNSALPIVKIGATTWYDNDNNSQAFAFSSPNIIPVGVIEPIFQGDTSTGFYTLNFKVNQFLFDHVGNRFSCGNGNFLTGLVGYPTGQGSSVANNRGIWDCLADTTDPADLKSQIFYPGDCVTVNNFDFDDRGSTGFFNGIFQYIGSNPLQINPGQVPNVWVDMRGDGAWKLVFYAINQNAL